MEAYTVIAFHKAAGALGDAAPDEDVTIDPTRWASIPTAGRRTVF